MDWINETWINKTWSDKAWINKHGVIKHGEKWINNIKYSQHKQIHDFLLLSLFRSSKLLILMNQ